VRSTLLDKESAGRVSQSKGKFQKINQDRREMTRHEFESSLVLWRKIKKGRGFRGENSWIDILGAIL